MLLPTPMVLTPANEAWSLTFRPDTIRGTLTLFVTLVAWCLKFEVTAPRPASVTPASSLDQDVAHQVEKLNTEGYEAVRAAPARPARASVGAELMGGPPEFPVTDAVVNVVESGAGSKVQYGGRLRSTLCRGSKAVSRTAFKERTPRVRPRS